MKLQTTKQRKLKTTWNYFTNYRQINKNFRINGIKFQNP